MAREAAQVEGVTWSVHKDTKRPDKAGRGNSTKFLYIEHQDLTAKIEFELKHNNYLQAAGNVWKRPGCIPMGGSFSAQSAELHCQWEVYQHRHLFRDLGTLQITASGFVYWETEWGVLSLCQFRDNILLATSFPDTPHRTIVQRVCSILQTAWKLQVLCPCDGVCMHDCLKSDVSAMGYTLLMHSTHQHTAFIQPSSLDSAWKLKLPPPPLLSPRQNTSTVYSQVC